MKAALVVMAGISFTLGVVFGLLLQLPSESSLPADPVHPGHDSHLGFRSRRSLSNGRNGRLPAYVSANRGGFHVQNDEIIRGGKNPANPAVQPPVVDVGNGRAVKENGGRGNGRLSHVFNKAVSGDNPIIGSTEDLGRSNNGQIDIPHDVLYRSEKENRVSAGNELRNGQSGETRLSQNLRIQQHPDLKTETVDSQRSSLPHNNKNSSLRMTINRRKVRLDDHAPDNSRRREFRGVNSSFDNTRRAFQRPSEEDLAYLASLIKGITWKPQLESSCPRPFPHSEVEQWRKRAESLDIVKMEEGCGRMQNRLLTFRDASKACARYRLNTDQIQGEVFSYYLGKLLNISNIPPTLLVRINALSSKWRTVHLDMSLAQWADNKLVVLTQFIPGLTPAHIPGEFRDQKHRLEPTLDHLGKKTHSELCDLVQWSDLIVLDYLTANLDRVINNMFNRQWNDQMMNNPAHNLEKFKDGRLVFLDNESGLFHGYRLLDKYARYHKSLLDSLCVFRPGTVEVVKRLHFSGSIGSELHTLFSQNEAFHEHLAGIPEKNVKILQQRLDDVYEQIVKCERNFNR